MILGDNDEVQVRKVCVFKREGLCNVHNKLGKKYSVQKYGASAEMGHTRGSIRNPKNMSAML